MYFKKSLTFFLSFCVLIVSFLVILVMDVSLYDMLSLEDGVVEYLTAIALFFTGVFLFYGSWLFYIGKKGKLAIVLLGFAGVLFLLGAGEEISWGQRIFDIQTPEVLLEVNDQDELNLHNVDKKFFDRLVDRGTIFFVLLTSVLLYFKVEKVIGISLPSVMVVLLFAITPFYHQYNTFHFDFYHLIYLALLGLFFISIKSKNTKEIVAVSITLLLSFVIAYVHTKYNHIFPVHNNSANEYKELLFSLCCLVYALELIEFRFFKSQQS